MVVRTEEILTIRALHGAPRYLGLAVAYGAPSVEHSASLSSCAAPFSS